MSASNSSLSPAFLSASDGEDEEEKRDWNEVEREEPMMELNSGTVERKEAIWEGGRNPQNPEKGVRATAISGCDIDQLASPSYA